MNRGQKLAVTVVGGFALSLVAPTPSASAWVDSELQFVNDIRAMGFGTGAGVDTIVAFGYAICTDLNNFSADDIAEAQSQRFGITRSQAAALVNAAKRDMCP